MTVLIRPCTPADYAAVAAASNAAYLDATGRPIWSVSAEDLREDEAKHAPHCRALRLVAEHDGQVVGAGEYDQPPHRYHPQRFWFDLYVHPAHQRQGIGAALYERVLAALAPLDPLRLRCNLREDFTASVRFLTARGWREAQRAWDSRLALAQVDLAAYQGVLDRLAGAGLVITTLEALESDPQRDQKLYDLVWEVRQDLPDLDEPTREPFADFLADRLHHPSIVPGGYFVAQDGDRYVGYIYHRRDPADAALLHIAQLGVARAYRGRGIAHGLKVHSLAFARAHGYDTLHTDNVSTNLPILSINARMGFVRDPAWVTLVKEFGAVAS